MNIAFEKLARLLAIEQVCGDIIIGPPNRRVIGRRMGEVVEIDQKEVDFVRDLAKRHAPPPAAAAASPDSQFLETLGKDELLAVAREKFGVELDKRHSLEALRKQILGLQPL